MVEEHYTNQQIIDLSGAGPTAVSRWKKQCLAEQRGEVVAGKTALNAENVASKNWKNSWRTQKWMLTC
jgi:transposase